MVVATVFMLGHYSFTLAEQVLNGQLRPLKNPAELEELDLE
ncbi:MAG: hypothetical protein R3222_02820 [Balneolaceae bacterium]|nr:hypothetical protein [Balneolaceae bacterium]